jgi:hypothetical protein
MVSRDATDVSASALTSTSSSPAKPAPVTVSTPPGLMEGGATLIWAFGVAVAVGGAVAVSVTVAVAVEVMVAVAVMVPVTIGVSVMVVVGVITSCDATPDRLGGVGLTLDGDDGWLKSKKRGDETADDAAIIGPHGSLLHHRVYPITNGGTHRPVVSGWWWRPPTDHRALITGHWDSGVFGHMVRAAHQRPGFDVLEAELQTLGFELHEFVRVVVPHESRCCAVGRRYWPMVRISTPDTRRSCIICVISAHISPSATMMPDLVQMPGAISLAVLSTSSERR